MAITDRVTYPKPALPLLSAAGYRFPDPTFGAAMVRVTDGQTAVANGGGGVANISFRSPSGTSQRGWGADSTRFIVNDTYGNFWPFQWNAATMTPTRGPSPCSLSGDLSFHNVNANQVYGRYGNRSLWVCDLSIGPTDRTLVVDLDTIITGLSALEGGNTYTGGMYIANDILTVTCGAGNNDYNFYLVWYPLSDPGSRKILNSLTRINPATGVPWNSGNGFRIHGSAPDLSGRYMIITPSDLSGDTVRLYLWDTTLDVLTPITAFPSGHLSASYERMVNQDPSSGAWDATQWTYRDLATPNSNLRVLIDPVMTPIEVYAAEHSCWNHATAANPMPPMVSGVYRYYVGTLNTVPFRAWDDEIISVQTDGLASTVWRHCHHRSNVAPETGGAYEFWSLPRPNTSPDGRWAMFTSNWEKTLGADAVEGIPRQDLFIVDLALVSPATDERRLHQHLGLRLRG